MTLILQERESVAGLFPFHQAAHLRISIKRLLLFWDECYHSSYSFTQKMTVIRAHARHESAVVRVDDFTSKPTVGRHSIYPLEDVVQATGLTF